LSAIVEFIHENRIFIPPIISALYIFIAIRYLSPHAYKITFTVWGVNYPPVAGKRGKNTVVGLRVKRVSTIESNSPIIIV